VATATVANGSFLMRHAPSAKMRIKKRLRAEAIAKAAAGHQGPLGVSIEEKRQTPPRLFDLPSLQKTCGQRWGWTADKTLSVAQELYDGDGKKLITYPRAEAGYLSENQISDVRAIAGRADFRAVIDGIAAVALELINALLGRSSGTVDLTLSTSTLRSGRRRPGRQAGNPTNLKDSKPVRRRRGTKAGQASTRKHAAAAIRGSKEEDKPCPTAPTPKMVAYAQSLARGKKVTPPEGYERDFKACRRFLDEHAR
jgi:hypothetical protein